jgi:hypothetical protein
MPTVTKYATTGQAAGGSFNGSWTNSTNVGSDNTVYATAAPGKNQEYASVFPIAFTTGEVPAGATINSALVEVQVKASTTSSVGIATSSLFADSAQATAIGAVPGVQTPTTEPTADTTYSFTRNPTEAQIRDLWVRVQATRGNSNTALTWSLDFVRVTIDYTEPPAAITGTGAVSFGFSESGSGSFSLPASTGTGGVAFGFAAAGSGAFAPPAITASGGVTFAFSSSGTGDYTPAPVTGTGSATFGFSLSGSGSAVAPSFTGDGDVAFGFSTAGTGTSSVPEFTGSGGSAFGFLLSGSGSSQVPTFTGSGDTTFGFASSGSGTSTVPEGAGAGGVTFGFSLEGSGDFTLPSVSGSGGVAFGFLASGVGSYLPPTIGGSGGVEFDFLLGGSSGAGSVLISAQSSVASLGSVSCGIRTPLTITSSVQVEQ